MNPQAWAVANEQVFRPLDFAREPWDSLIDVAPLSSSGQRAGVESKPPSGALLAPFDSGK